MGVVFTEIPWRVDYGFVLPETPNVAVVPIVPKLHQNSAVEKRRKMIGRAGIKLVDVTGIEPVTPCLQRTGVLSHRSFAYFGF